jgi:hypothetical protein
MLVRERRLALISRGLAALVLLLTTLASAGAVHAADQGGRSSAPASTDAAFLTSWAPVHRADPALYFAETGYAIEERSIADYFSRRGGPRTFGYPTSRTFKLLGLPTQFFQRAVLQVAPDGGVQPLNLLDPGLLSFTRINGSTFPAADERFAAAAPSASRPDYAVAVVDFVRQNAPETFKDQPVRFFTTFNNTVTMADAFPRGGDPRLLPLINLEIWGIPTSPPVQDPNNLNFIYQRFQRGIMHYDAGCRCTQGLLLADYFKALLTGESLPPDLEEQARGSRFLRQYNPATQGSLARPSQLPDTDLRDAFVRQPGPPVAVAAPAVVAPTDGPMRTRIRVDQGLRSAVDALENADRLDQLNAILDSGAEVVFDDLPPTVHAKYSRLGLGARRAPVRTLAISARWRNADPKALATLIAHEGTHLEDDLEGFDASTKEGCIEFELRAFTEQAIVWQGFYGPTGKTAVQTDLDRELNAWLAVYRRGPEALDQRVRQLYDNACPASD